jgi:rhodanese-related sulfurtransferase
MLLRTLLCARGLLCAPFVTVLLLIGQGVHAASPLGLSPEQLQARLAKGERIVLLSAADAVPANAAPGSAAVVFYDVSLSGLRARQAAERLRAQGNPESFYLFGTPATWQLPKLPTLLKDNLPDGPLAFTPQDLAAALDEELPLTLLDVRSPGMVGAMPFPEATPVLPHELKAVAAAAPKKSWIVLVDDGNGAAGRFAGDLSQSGIKLVGVLDGGYPAWIARPASPAKTSR